MINMLGGLASSEGCEREPAPGLSPGLVDGRLHVPVVLSLWVSLNFPFAKDISWIGLGPNLMTSS